jgi:hypothetical protein
MAGYIRPGKVFTAELYESLLQSLELANIQQHGRGVLDGLTITAGSGLTLNISSGVMRGLREVELTSTSDTMPASSTRFVWIDEDGDVITTATLGDPGGTFVCLGQVVTDGSSIISVSASGRMSLFRTDGLRKYRFGEKTLVVDIENNRIGVVNDTMEYALDLRQGGTDGIAAMDGAFLGERGSIPATPTDGCILYQRGDNLEVRMPSGEVFLLVHNTGGLNLPGGLPQRIAKLDATVSRAASSGTGENVIWQMPTLAADFTTTGDYFLLRFAGRLTQTASGPTHRLRLRWSAPSSPTAGTILVDTGAKNVGSARTNGGWIVQNLLISDRGEGAGGEGFRAYWPTGRIEGLFSSDTYPGGGAALGPAGTDTPATAAVDVVANASRCLVLTVEWSATTSGNTFFIDNGELYICKGVM